MFKHKEFFGKRIFLFLIFSIFLSLFYFSVPNFLFDNPSQLVVYSKNYDPTLNWNVIEGKHYSIIFPTEIPDKEGSPYKQIALHIAEIAEEIYSQITLQFGTPYNPDKKFAIILEDFHDSTYGFASTVPHYLIRINLTAPGPEIFDTKFESWLRILIAHEYTHLAHFDMTDKMTTFLRFFLGQTITPNALQPLWSIEGLAIYNESRLNAGRGRLKDSRYEMYLRTDFLENRLKNLEQLEGGHLISWPAGNAPYIYGQSLVHFIAEVYGEEKLIAISKQFSSFPLLGMDWALKKVLGIDQNKLYQRWKCEKEQYFEQQVRRIVNSDKITESQQITDHCYWVECPSWLIDNDIKDSSLTYRVFKPHLYSTIRKYNRNSGKESLLIKRTGGHGTSYSFSPDFQYLLYAKQIQYSHYYTYNDLFLFHLNTGKQYQLTERMRIKDPAWHPVPAVDKIVAVINQAGSNNLVLFSIQNIMPQNEPEQMDLINTADLTYLTNFKDGSQISQPVWSPQGDRIAFSLWRKGYQDIYVITLDEDHLKIQSIIPITYDRYTDISPNWSVDGQYLFFSSDRNKIFNLYAYSLPDNQFYRLTNVATGAFEPAVSPSGKEMAFVQYHASGYELHVAKMDDLLWELIEETDMEETADVPHLQDNVIYFLPLESLEDNEVNQSLALPHGIPKNTHYTLKSYSPWDSIMPNYLFPYADIAGGNLYLGASTLAQDYLGFYSIPLTLAYNLSNNSLFYNLQCLYTACEPSFSLTWQGETSYYTRLQLSLEFSDSGYTGKGDSDRLYSRNITMGTLSECLFTVQGEQDELSEKTPVVTNSLFLRYTYSDTEKYQWSIGPEIGNLFSVNYQYAVPYTDHEAAFHRIIFDSRKYLPLPVSNQVLALRLVAGYSSSEIDKNAIFSLGGNSSAQNLSSFNSKDFALRGYPSSSFAGNHLLLCSLEYRFPLKRVEQKIGYKGASLFLEQVFGALFIEAGHAWNKNSFPRLKDFNASLGAEVGFILKTRYTEPLTLAFGIGKAITQTLPTRFYGRIGLSF